MYCGGLWKDTEQGEAEEAEGLAAKESQNTCIMNSVSSRKADSVSHRATDAFPGKPCPPTSGTVPFLLIADSAIVS